MTDREAKIARAMELAQAFADVECTFETSDMNDLTSRAKDARDALEAYLREVIR